MIKKYLEKRYEMFNQLIFIETAQRELLVSESQAVMLQKEFKKFICFKGRVLNVKHYSKEDVLDFVEMQIKAL